MIIKEKKHQFQKVCYHILAGGGLHDPHSKPTLKLNVIKAKPQFLLHFLFKSLCMKFSIKYEERPKN